VHDVFLKLLENPATFRGDSSPATWLYRVATRLCLDRLRQTVLLLVNVLTSARIAQPQATSLELVERVRTTLALQAQPLRSSVAPPPRETCIDRMPDQVPDKGRVEELLRRHGGNVARVANDLELSR